MASIPPGAMQRSRSVGAVTPEVSSSSSEDEADQTGDVASLFVLRDQMFRDELFVNDLEATAKDYDRLRWYAQCLMLLELPEELQGQYVNILDRVQLAAQQAVGWSAVCGVALHSH
jgi:hypothetical protein